MAKKSAKPDKTLRQRPLPKMGIRKIPALDAAAEHNEDCKKAFGLAGEAMKESESNLRAMMKERKLTFYKTPSEITVIYTSKDKVSTKPTKAEKAQ